MERPSSDSLGGEPEDSLISGEVMHDPNRKHNLRKVKDIHVACRELEDDGGQVLTAPFLMKDLNCWYADAVDKDGSLIVFVQDLKLR